tara:strand:+ start:520 stop:648 length:129 start_codon:yes stop_codon:yes gene_type:complete
VRAVKKLSDLIRERNIELSKLKNYSEVGKLKLMARLALNGKY